MAAGNIQAGGWEMMVIGVYVLLVSYGHERERYVDSPADLTTSSWLQCSRYTSV